MSNGGRYTDYELEQVRERNPLSQVLPRFGIQLKKAGREWRGLSPFGAEKTPSFYVNDEKGFYHCFSTGNHGDVIDAAMHFKGMEFVDAVEWLGGVKEVTPEERVRIERKKAEQTEAERRKREQQTTYCDRVWGEAQRIEGTHAAAYLTARGLQPDPAWTFDLRFVPSLGYKGFTDPDADDDVALGKFPAMVAAIRDVNLDIIGLHRTYLDPDQPTRLKPPGDPKRNAAKKVLGEQTGGLIWLSRPTCRLAIGEGIETTRSWLLLGYGGDDISIASAVSLGNLSGGATGSIPHPTLERKWIPNGQPDMQWPGARLPADVLEVILLGDGDSEQCMTRQRLLVAARRFKHEGRDVLVHMAPKGADFNDRLMEAPRA